MIKEKRKKKKRFLHFLKILSSIIIVLALLFLIALKLFTVKQVEVDGNVLYDDETIENVVLNDKYSWNSLYVFTGAGTAEGPRRQRNCCAAGCHLDTT